MASKRSWRVQAVEMAADPSAPLIAVEQYARLVARIVERGSAGGKAAERDS